MDEIEIHTKAELWCNKQNNMGCRIQRCLQAFKNTPECREYKTIFLQCVDDRKNEIRKNQQAKNAKTSK